MVASMTEAPAKAGTSICSEDVPVEDGGGDTCECVRPVCTPDPLLTRLNNRIEAKDWEAATHDCWILERIWKLLADIEDLQLQMDPDDFLWLKSQLAIRSAPDDTDAPFCFWSRALLHAANATRDIEKLVSWVIGVEVDPNVVPRVQEAAMRLYHSRRRGEGEDAGKIELLQAFQNMEAAVRRFFFAYRQVVAVVCGTAEASDNRGAVRAGGGDKPHN
ncbi:Hs1 [Hordeum vulgare]|nr:Hs1 [Hordeum vulgare]